MKLLIGVDADTATGIALLNCLVREISGPEQQLRTSGDDRLELRLARVGVCLRARLLRKPSGPSLRLAPPIEEHRDDEWQEIGWERLADLVSGELELATGRPNPEFVPQVRSGHQALQAILANRPPGSEAISYLGSEQSLVSGHRFHPTPKARQGDPAEWLPHAPEVRARFALRWLAIREELTVGEGDTSAIDRIAPPTPPGFRPLPVHPWQYDLLGPQLASALASGAVQDLEAWNPLAVATSSVRTVYIPDHDLFLKFSLDVRITNCVRKNSWYELSSAVALTGLLDPVFAELSALFDNCVLLPEPGFRTASLADRRLYEGLGVIIREGLGSGPGTPVLAGALADPYGCGPVAIGRLLGSATREEVVAWWDAYVRLLLPPILHAYLKHGVVLEPHLQNVLVRLDASGLPAQAIFRDLEGTKLLRSHWTQDLHESVFYDAERGWNRVVYCLFVNHLAEIAAALSDLHPDVESDLWATAQSHIAAYELEHIPEGSARLRAVLAGVPLPAKANLRARWARDADRAATYVTVPNPFRR